MHAGESVSLTRTSEQSRRSLEFAIRHSRPAASPSIAHVSDTGTAIAAARARHAEEAGRGRHRRRRALLLDAAGRRCCSSTSSAIGLGGDACPYFRVQRARRDAAAPR